MIIDLERKWILRAKCAGMSVDDFFTDQSRGNLQVPPPRLQAAWDKAKLACQGCPVIMECGRDFLGETEGVWGGMDPVERHRTRAEYSLLVRKLDPERRARYERLAWKLHVEHKYKQQDVCRLMGLTPRTVASLIGWHTRWLEEHPQQEAPRVVDLELPEQPERITRAYGTAHFEQAG